MKELVINGKLYCHYEIDELTTPRGVSVIVFIKVRNELVGGNVIDSETLMAQIISAIENKKLTGISYLNIK